MSAEEIVSGHLDVLENRNCSLLLNCPPNPDDLMDENVVKRLTEVD